MRFDRRLYVNNAIVWLLLAETILDGLAIAAGDTTLVNAMIPTLLVSLKYVIALLIIPLLYKSGVQKSNVNLCVLPIIYWVVLFVNERSNNIDLNILTPLLLCLYCLVNSDCKRKIFEYYRVYLIIMSCLGILACLSVLLPIGIPYKIVEYYGSEAAVYLDFKFSYIYMNDDIPRLCGLFNEPGYLGTVAALILIADGCRLRHWGNIVIIIAGGLSLSLAFFMLIVLYFVLRQVKNPIRLIVAISIFVLFIVSIPNIKVDNPGIQRLINRFYIEDGNQVFVSEGID